MVDEYHYFHLILLGADAKVDEADHSHSGIDYGDDLARWGRSCRLRFDGLHAVKVVSRSAVGFYWLKHSVVGSDTSISQPYD